MVDANAEQTYTKQRGEKHGETPISMLMLGLVLALGLAAPLLGSDILAYAMALLLLYPR
jgi:hypothetical protein